MGIWDLLKFLIIFFMPWIIGKFFRILSNAAKAQQQESNKKEVVITVPSLWDRIRISVLLVAIVNYFWISLGGGAPKNFFQQIGANVDAPVFQMRTCYADFIAKQAESSKAFSSAFEVLKDSCCSNGSPEEFDLFRERLWSKSQKISLPILFSEEDPLTSNEGLRYQKFQCLFERLKSPTRRSNYLQYGDEATLHCDWCSDETDYSLFVLFHAAKAYCVFLVLIGLVSTNKEKKTWRKILVVIILFFGIFESLYYLAPHEVASLDLYSDIFSDGDNVGLTQKLTIFRHLVFGILLLAALLFDNGISIANGEQIAAIVEQHKSISNLLNLERLQKSVLVANKELRKHYIANFEKIENATKASLGGGDNGGGDYPTKPTNFDVLDSILVAKEDNQ